MRYFGKILLMVFIFSLLITVIASAKTVRLVYVEWADAIAGTNVVKAVLQEKMGYDVQLNSVSAAVMWQSVATGNADAMVGAWLPTTHGNYLENVKNKVKDLGPNLIGTKIGLVVPQYVSIESIGELQSHAEKFNNKIIGIDPGAGIMSKTEKAIEEYELDDFKLVTGSGAAMTAALKDSIQKKKWVVVTGWTPHWKFARWDLKYLKDPKNIYGGEEEIHTIVSKDLKSDMPKVYEFLDNFYWEPAEMQKVMNWNIENRKPYENAKKWVNQNPEKVQKWLP